MIALHHESDDNTQSRLWSDFNRICDFGGRLAGTEGEQAAFAYLEKIGFEATAVAPRSIRVAYEGWSATRAELRLTNGSLARCHPLIRSPSTPFDGLMAEVVDLGRGTPDDFAAHSAVIAGRIVLVRHELMFAAGTIHRRIKYNMAIENGAVGFLIVGPLSGHMVAGSSGASASGGIPAAGISPETAAQLARGANGYPAVCLIIETEHAPAETKTLLFDLPGQTDEWVVLSAHVDGHDLAESAIDNASGLAVALEVARGLAPEVAGKRRGLRLAFFSVEEWALTGSAQYVESLFDTDRAKIALNVNLDSVAGGAELTAMTSGFAGLEDFLQEAAMLAGTNLKVYLPLQMNSDHGNFAQAGIPAFRLVAGFDDSTAATRFVLTPEDTRDKVSLDQLTTAARLSTSIVQHSLAASTEQVNSWRGR